MVHWSTFPTLPLKNKGKKAEWERRALGEERGRVERARFGEREGEREKKTTECLVAAAAPAVPFRLRALEGEKAFSSENSALQCVVLLSFWKCLHTIINNESVNPIMWVRHLRFPAKKGFH